jgi:peptidoglycan/xylan/chitin deacetylase (PgdA/CDA1 family)
VLGYHLVGAGTSSGVEVSEATLRSHLVGLRASATVGEARHWSDQASLRAPRRRDGEVVLTFDDAFENFYSVVYPILLELEWTALLFVPVGFVDGSGDSPLAGAEHLPPMTWDQLREVTRDGRVVVGSHSWTHPDLRSLDERALHRELQDSRGRLEDELGVAVRAFCYPRALWSRRVEKAVGEAYEVAFVAGGLRVPTGGRVNPVRIPRVPIRRDMPASLEPVLGSRVWLEEWIADKVRRHLRRRGRAPSRSLTHPGTR